MNKMKLILAMLIFAPTLASLGQKHFTKSGEISFVSDAPLEKIEAVNHQASSVIDLESGRIQWAVLIKAFEFEKALMEEHFNENYLESSKYPKATFKGKIADHEKIDLASDNEIVTMASGILEIHGVAREVDISVSLLVDKSTLTGHTKFEVLLSDFNIEIPAVVADNLSNTVEIEVKASYEKM